MTDGAKNPAARSQKVMSKKKKRDARATEDLKVARRKIKVMILDVKYQQLLVY
jgi:hypothetical protein